MVDIKEMLTARVTELSEAIKQLENNYQILRGRLAEATEMLQELEKTKEIKQEKNK